MKLAAAFVIVFVIALYSLFAWWVYPSAGLTALPIDQRGQLGDTFGILNALLSSLGFAGILLTLYLQNKELAAQAKNNDAEVAERRSMFNLEASIQAYSNAFDLLRDGNNNRATWVRAARILLHGKVLADAVTVDAHKRALELRLLDFRSGFRDIINQSPEFFYGEGAPILIMDLDEAARVSSSPDAAVPGQEVTATRWLDEKSLYVVLEASQWPEGYQDPLQIDLPSDEELEKKTFFARGLRRFLQHRQQWHTYGGQLRPRNRSQSGD